VNSLGFGAQVKGVVSLEEIERRLGDDYDPPGPFAQMPNPFTESQAFKEAVRLFSDRTLKPIGSAIAPFLRNTLDKRGLPDVVFERAGRDGLALATSLVKPNVGKVVYAEELSGQRFTFYAPQVWMRQRRIIMPSAEIRGTHLNTAREFAEMQERIAAAQIDVLAASGATHRRHRRDPPGDVGEPSRRCELCGDPCPPAYGPQNQRRALPRLGAA
jgi:acrylyl-CoA reductase (NADPH)/3-hydroxypropionyl-CoA dehydratase/3-hydroxypropionyl-CoA synthetase